ncbi:MAG TPA: glycosyltransferase family 4 protein [Candidatus Saccharimonadales bacterium]|jgi:phosphatidylinositol alpha-mannosyltransferase
MRIGLVLDESLDKPDGVQQYVLTLGTWLTGQGHEVHYLVGQSVRTDIPNVHSMARNVTIQANGNKLSIPRPVSRASIRKKLAELQLDVIHVQTPHSPLFGHRVVMEASDLTAIVATFHVLPHSSFIEYGMRPLALVLRSSYRRIDQLIANSTATQEFITRSCHLPSIIIPNPITLANFAGAQGFPEFADKPTIVYLNRLVARKGASHLLEAVQHIRTHRLIDTPFRVLICGKGEESPRLEAFIKEHRLEDVITMTGFVSEADKPRYIASADLAVYPSTGGESFGIVLLEGMASAKGPVIAGNNPGYASVMRPHPEQLIDPRNTAAFAVLLAGYLQDAPARQAAVAWQRDYVRQFDVGVVGSTLVDLYGSILAKRRGAEKSSSDLPLPV